jgi:hypothetical protein
MTNVNILIEYFTCAVVFLTIIVGSFSAFPIIFSKPLDWYYGPINVWGLIYVIITIIISYFIVDHWLRVSLERLESLKH